MSDPIMERVQSDYDYVEGLGYKVLGVFLQGSQNYNLQYEGSDIDTKCIVLPSFEDFCLNRKPVSTTLILPSNEHIDVKDIRLMFECFKKQNINFIEILFTKYRLLNQRFAEAYQPMLDNAEAIAHYNNYAFVNCMAGMSMEKYKALEHPYPTIVDKIEKFGYDPKQLHHILRINEVIKRFLAGESYADSLISKMPQYLINVKRGCHSLDEARKLAKQFLDDTISMKDKLMATEPIKINKNVDELMNSVLIQVLKDSFREDIGIQR